MIEFLRREWSFLTDLWNTVVPTILAMKLHIDKAMEVPIIKFISMGSSISGGIYLIAKIGKSLSRRDRY